MSELFLGVDGGQSSTTAVIGDQDGKIVGWGVAGPCNHVGVAEGRAKFVKVIRECLEQASRRAGIEESHIHFRAACFGMSGGPADKKALLEELLDADHLEVTTDAMIALSGAMAGGSGVIVIAGTGSISYGRSDSGEIARAGGWGFLFGDEGGGFDIARQGLRSILREHEGWGARTALMPALLAAGESQDANELLHRFYTADWPRAKVAQLAQVVSRIAEEGDPVAAEILHRAAQDLAMLAAAVKRQLWREGDQVDLAYIGGVFSSLMLRERFRALVELDGSTRCIEPKHSPAIGALFEAYRACQKVPEFQNLPVLKT